MTARGVVKVRLSGPADDIAAVAALLGRLQDNAVAGHVAIMTPAGRIVECPVPEVLEKSMGHANRRDPGYRVSLTLRLALEGRRS